MANQRSSKEDSGKHYHIALLSRGDIFPPDHGAAVKLYRMAEALSRRGHKIYLIANRPDIYWEFAGGTVRDLATPNWLARLPRPPEAKLRRFMENLGVPAADAFLFAPLIDPSYQVRAAALARKHGCTIAQFEFPGYAGPAAAVARATGAKIVGVEHNLEYLRIRDSAHIGDCEQRHIRELELFALRLADEVVLVSAIERDLLISQGLAPDRLWVIPHGIDLENYQAPDKAAQRRQLNLGAKELVLIFHGVLHYPPNAEAVDILAREIAPRLKARGLKAKILVVGRNPPAGLDPELFVTTGAVPHPAPFLAAADIAVVPLIGGGGTRLKILEYFAAGLPVISTRKGAEGLLVSDDAQLLLRDDWTEFAEAITELAGNGERQRRLGEAASRWVKAYGWDEIARRYEIVYHRPRLAARLRWPARAAAWYGLASAIARW